jgi:hypothetical protein
LHFIYPLRPLKGELLEKKIAKMPLSPKGENGEDHFEECKEDYDL